MLTIDKKGLPLEALEVAQMRDVRDAISMPDKGGSAPVFSETADLAIARALCQELGDPFAAGHHAGSAAEVEPKGAHPSLDDLFSSKGGTLPTREELRAMDACLAKIKTSSAA